MELADLSRVAQNAATAKAITGEWDYPGFDQLLKELIAYDKTMDARVGRRKIWMLISIFICTLAFVTMIVSIQLWRKSKKLALPEAALEMLHQLVRFLHQDLDPKAKITTTIDLSGLTDEKKQSIIPMQWSYLDPWCTIRFKLRDGYVVLVRQTDSFIETTRTRKNARGKKKSKTNWKKQSRVTARIIPPAPVKWGAPPKVDHVWERIKVVAKQDLSVAVLDRWWAYKTPTHAPTDAPPAKEIVGMLFRLCSMRPLEAN